MKLMLQVILIVQLWYRDFNWMVRQSRVIAVYQKISVKNRTSGAPLSLSVPLINLFFGAILLEVFPVISDLNYSKPE